MRQQKIIWGALFFSTVIYVGIAYSFAPDPALPFSESVAQSTALALYGAAFAAFLAAMVVPSLLVNLAPEKRMVVALSMFEACSIMGLLAAFLLKDWRLIVPAWIASLIGFMREFPRDEVSAPA
jgi:MFS family permease